MGAIVGLFHEPYGTDSPYQFEPSGRYPRDPMAGNAVFIKVMTWPIQTGQSVWVTWTKNGVAQQPIGAAWQSNDAPNSYWQAAIPPLERGDEITYSVWALFQDTAPEPVTVGPFSFSVTSFSTVTSVLSYEDHGTSVDIHAGDSAGSFQPAIRFAFPTPDSFRVQLAPSGRGLRISGQASYTVTDSADSLILATTALVLEIQKSPYRLQVFQRDGVTPVLREQDPAVFSTLTWASDGKSTINRIGTHFVAPSGERYYGFGERYDAFDQRGKDVWSYVLNEYLDQAQTEHTYLAVPFYLSSAGYGVYLATTALSIFNVDTYTNTGSQVRDMEDSSHLPGITSIPNMLGFTMATADGLDSTMEYYVFTGTPAHILETFTSVTARPRLPPKWAFGLWMSAHGWNTQAQVESTLATAAELAIPGTVLVLEQWADEATFYAWHGSTYKPVPGGEAQRYGDFTFPAGGRWLDPRAMVAEAHQRGVRVVLWQIPVFKAKFSSNPSYPPPQHLADTAWAVTQGYVIDDGSGGQYRIAAHQWFEDSMMPDFTNPAGSDWWLSKRRYLVEDIGIDGFKCDGSEIILGRNLRFADRRWGDVMHNGYPAAYIGAYRNFLTSVRGGDTVLFSRAGAAGAQALSIYWAGDQKSTFGAFAEALRAGLSAGQSGVPYWSWDLAGFSGDLPSCELYLRAAAMAAFCPVMEFHSEQDFVANGMANSDGIGQPRERTPWNIAAQNAGDPLAPLVVPTFRKLASARMNLLPYIYTEAKRSADTGVPMMRAMCFEFPADAATAELDAQYMFGGAILVAPVVTQGATSVPVYLPAGEWFDVWNSGTFTGPGTKTYGAWVETLPVYARPGAILPLNCDDTYQLGASVGNSVSHYTNLTFRIYPLDRGDGTADPAEGAARYDFYDDAHDVMRTIEAAAHWDAHAIDVKVPAFDVPVTLQVIAGQPTGVLFNSAAVSVVASPATLASGAAGWCWDPVLQAVLVRLPAGRAGEVTLTGINKIAYLAAQAMLTGTSVATDHAGYTGTGFVDGFDAAGDAVTFSVNADLGASTALTFRYANATGAAATRNVYVDGNLAGTIDLPALATWDEWGLASLVVSLAAGPHTIRFAFDTGNQGPINLDSLTLRVDAAPALRSVGSPARAVGRRARQTARTS